MREVRKLLERDYKPQSELERILNRQSRRMSPTSVPNTAVRRMVQKAMRDAARKHSLPRTLDPRRLLAQIALQNAPGLVQGYKDVATLVLYGMTSRTVKGSPGFWKGNFSGYAGPAPGWFWFQDYQNVTIEFLTSPESAFKGVHKYISRDEVFQPPVSYYRTHLLYPTDGDGNFEVSPEREQRPGPLSGDASSSEAVTRTPVQIFAPEPVPERAEESPRAKTVTGHRGGGGGYVGTRYGYGRPPQGVRERKAVVNPLVFKLGYGLTEVADWVGAAMDIADFAASHRYEPDKWDEIFIYALQRIAIEVIGDAIIGRLSPSKIKYGPGNRYSIRFSMPNVGG